MDVPRRARARGAVALLQLAAELWIDGAAQRSPVHDGLRETVVAADAAVDGVPAALLGLQRKRRVGEELAADAEEVHRALLDHADGNGRIVDAGAADDRHAQVLARPAVDVEPLAGRAIDRLGPEIGLHVPGDRPSPEGEIEYVHTGVLEQGGDVVARLLGADPAGRAFVEAQAEDDRHLLADHGADAADDGRRRHGRLAVLVGAVVVERREEAGEGPAVGAFDVDGVEPRAHGALGAAGVVLEHGLDLVER